MPLEIAKALPEQSIIVREQSDTAEESQTSADATIETVQLGQQYQLTARLGAISISAQDFSDASWTILGNLHVCESVEYSAKCGKIVPARLDSFPLNVSFGPATTKPFLRPISLKLAGSVKVSTAVWAAPETFDSTCALTGAPPAEAVSENVEHYGTDIKAVFDEACDEWKVGMQTGSGSHGAGVTWNVSSMSKSSGSFSVVQLVKLKTDHIDTGDAYFFDGQDFPNTKIASGPEQKNILLSFKHDAGLRINPREEPAGSVRSFSATYLTYLLYQDDFPGSVPILLDFPLTWGLSFKARFVKETGDSRGSVVITDDKIEPLSKANSLSLPQWSSCVKSTDLQSTTTPQPSMQKAKPSKASRSVNVEFRNRSDAFLSRSSYELEQGVWSKSLSPPEQIGAGSREMPVTVSWGAETEGQTAGIEGEARYLLQDGQTALHMSWNNPKTAGNSYSINLSGPLASKYRCTWGAGAGDDANPYFLLMSVN